MRLSINKFDKSRFGTFCNFAVPLILLLQLSLPGVALCFGADGHVALESYSQGLCDGVSSEFSSQDSSISFLQTLNNSDSRHCGACIDIPITDNNSENKVTALNNLTAEIDIHAFSVFQLKSQMPLESSRQSLLTEELPTYKSFLESLQTTVITC